jgi:hypothetical protein
MPRERSDMGVNASVRTPSQNRLASSINFRLSAHRTSVLLPNAIKRMTPKAGLFSKPHSPRIARGLRLD